MLWLIHDKLTLTSNRETKGMLYYPTHFPSWDKKRLLHILIRARAPDFRLTNTPFYFLMTSSISLSLHYFPSFFTNSFYSLGNCFVGLCARQKIKKVKITHTRNNVQYIWTKFLSYYSAINVTIHSSRNLNSHSRLHKRFLLIIFSSDRPATHKTPYNLVAFYS